MWGVLAAAGIGAAVSGLNSYFGGRAKKRAAEKARREQEQEADEAKVEQEKILAKQKEDYKNYSLDPTAMKKEYGEAVQRNLQQQAGGMTAALSSQRGMNAALASHLLTSSNSEREATSAGQSALEEANIQYGADRYNKQLQQNLTDQQTKAQLGISKENELARYNAMMQTERVDAEQAGGVLSSIINGGAMGGAIGMKLFGGQIGQGNQGGPTNTAPDTAPNRISLDGNEQKGPNGPSLGIDSSYTPSQNWGNPIGTGYGSLMPQSSSSQDLSGFTPGISVMPQSSSDNSISSIYGNHDSYSPLIAGMHGEDMTHLWSDMFNEDKNKNPFFN